MQMEQGDKRNTSKLAGTHFLHVDVTMAFLNGMLEEDTNK